MRTLYIVPKATWEAKKDYFCPFTGSHFIELDATTILVSTSFHKEENEEDWLALPDVDALPHPAYEGRTPLKASHVQKLAGLGIKNGDTVLDVANKAASKNPGMQISKRFRP
jgi:hypothetical protein